MDALMEAPIVEEAATAIADTVSSDTVNSSINPVKDDVIQDSSKIMPSNEELNKIESAPLEHNSPVNANSIITQNFPRDNLPSFNAKPTDNLTAGTADKATSTNGITFNNNGSAMNMSDIKTYFNQPISSRNGSQNQPSFNTRNNVSSDNLSKLTSSLLLGPRLAFNPTISFNQQKQPDHVQYNNVGSQHN